MTKQEAIEGMQSGGHEAYMTHKLFTKGEYIHIKHGIIHNENDEPLKDFWDYRKGREWNGGWEIEEFPGFFKNNIMKKSKAGKIKEETIKFITKEIFLAGYSHKDIPEEEFKKYSDRFVNENCQRIIKSIEWSMPFKE